jgi:hypothetical protein
MSSTLRSFSSIVASRLFDDSRNLWVPWPAFDRSDRSDFIASWKFFLEMRMDSIELFRFEGRTSSTELFRLEVKSSELLPPAIFMPLFTFLTEFACFVPRDLSFALDQFMCG